MNDYIEDKIFMKNSIKQVLVDPRCKINYASYYIYGLYKLFGTSKIKFAILGYHIDSYRDLQKGFGLLIKYDNDKEVKVFVDTNDTNSIYETFYDWCDVYAKINVKKEDVKKSKIFAIGPSFGVKLWNPVVTIFKAFINYFRVKKANDSYVVPFIIYLKDYIYTFWRRLDYESYSPGLNEDKNYIFAMSTLWYDNVSLQTVNKFRGEFIRTSQKIYPYFAGGLFYIPGAENKFAPYAQYKEEFKEVLTSKRISMNDYLYGTKRSALVFNTPSVCHCHGWKLAEYLSMGKAIISTPLSNVMPGDFIDGVHYICCDNIQHLESVIRSMHDNEAKRQALKSNAKKYYEEYLSPLAVVTRILDRAYLCLN